MRGYSWSLLLTAGVFSVLAIVPEGAPMTQASGSQAPMQLFLLAGQSNMAGRGTVADEDRTAHPRVWMFSRGLQWTAAIEPMHFDKPIAGVGPGRTFGLALAEAQPAAHIGLIPAAVGGSPITTWSPGVLYKETGAHPWDDALQRVRAAMPAGELKAVLWHQGESDATADGAPRYEERLRGLIARVRVEFRSPSLPFIIGQLGRFEGRPWNEWYRQVDEAHRRIGSEVPNAAYVSSEGLADNKDNLHFSAEAARELGRRYANVYLSMASGRSRPAAD